MRRQELLLTPAQRVLVPVVQSRQLWQKAHHLTPHHQVLRSSHSHHQLWFSPLLYLPCTQDVDCWQKQLRTSRSLPLVSWPSPLDFEHHTDLVVSIRDLVLYQRALSLDKS